MPVTFACRTRPASPGECPAAAVPDAVRGRARGAVLRPGRGAGRRGAHPPSDRIRTGHIGVGGQGSGHLGGIRRQSGDAGDGRLRSVPVQTRSGQAAGRGPLRGRRSARAPTKAATPTPTSASWSRRDDIDAVVIASPEFWHALHSVWAMRHGKDVYCEKAMTLTVYESQAVRETARRHGRVFQLGTQQRSDRNFRFAAELALNGYLGKLHTVKVAGARRPRRCRWPSRCRRRPSWTTRCGSARRPPSRTTTSSAATTGTSSTTTASAGSARGACTTSTVRLWGVPMFRTRPDRRRRARPCFPPGPGQHVDLVAGRGRWRPTACGWSSPTTAASRTASASKATRAGSTWSAAGSRPNRSRC